MRTFEQIKEVKMTLKIHGAVLSYLADANGKPVNAMNEDNATFIKTDMFLTDDRSHDEAYAAYEILRDKYPNALFISLQDDSGESLI